MLQPKTISRDAIPAALERATRYRLLNEPLEAESICRDILNIAPDHREAQTTLLLALTDQFCLQYGVDIESVKPILSKLADPFDREYFAGIMHERWGKALLEKGTPQQALPWIHQAMRCFDRAAELSSDDQPDAVLRWNTCARVLQRYGLTTEYSPDLKQDIVGDYGDDVPPR